MSKPFAVIVILMSLVLLGLSMTSPLESNNVSYLSSSNDSDTVKPVVFPYNDNNNFINTLSGFTYVAHRGAPVISRKPENSIEAFKAAKESGYKIVETDLQLTKDGQWIIIHDYILDRTTNGKGTVRSHSLKEIEKLRLKGNVNENFAIPTLNDFLKLCSSEKLIPILDIKPNEKEMSSRNYSDLLNSLNKYKLLDKSIFCSYSKEVLFELRKRSNVTTIAVMMDVNQDNLDFANKLRNAFMYCNYEKTSDEKIQLIRNNKLKFGVWTINDETVADYFNKKGAIMIVTDKLKIKAKDELLKNESAI
ncbi:glycerophosphodiester phosphodiesterase family protein [Clostridiales bacterium oral taxon 876 str. F0540]|nr:glycerophosphodiester phosphodiesterase family protein [Clostridiales bacterium oral taxon 876 str. F0540]